MSFRDLENVFEYRLEETTEENKERVWRSLCWVFFSCSPSDEELNAPENSARISEEIIRQQFDRITCYSCLPLSTEKPIDEAGIATAELREKGLFDLFVEWVLQHPLSLPELEISPRQQLQCAFEAYLPAFFTLAVFQALYEVFEIMRRNETSE